MRLQHHGMIGLHLHLDNVLKRVIIALMIPTILVVPQFVVKAPFVFLIIGEEHIVNQILGVNLQQQPLLKYHVLHQAKSAGMEQMVG